MKRSVICQIWPLTDYTIKTRHRRNWNLLLKIENYFPDINHFELFTGTESEENIRLYKKNGYIENKSKILNDHISLIFL